MAKKIGVLVVHGIGQQTDGFAEQLIAAVRDRLGRDAESVEFEPALWANVLERDEAKLLEDLRAKNTLDFVGLRRFVVSFLGDAVAYQRVPEGQQKTDIYGTIHGIIARHMFVLRERLGTDAPLVVVAHSLGCHIISNYIWDLQHPNKASAVAPATRFERAETLAGMFTLGCNIALFSLAYNRMLPITFPSNTVAQSFPGRSAAEIEQATCWLNMFDRDDILGYPLKPLSPEYAATVTEDREVNVGNIVTSWTPLSHNEYWTDRDVVVPITDGLQALLRLL